MDAIVGSTFYRFVGLLGCLLLTTATLAGGGYLARVGPKLLRFAQPPPRHDPEKVLPPLTMNDLAPAENTAPTEEFGPQLPEGPAASGEVSLPPQESDLPLADSAAEAPRRNTPEALLQYFTQSSRGREAVITTPVEFTPPAPGPGKSSTATYILQ